MKIPKTIKLGGYTINVKIQDMIDDGKTVGMCIQEESTILLAKQTNDSTLSEDAIVTTFFHECVHFILELMNENELDNNEKFVNLFAVFLHELYQEIEKNQ